MGPLLLIGWSEVGPGLLQAISTTSSLTVTNDADQPDPRVAVKSDDGGGAVQPQSKEEVVVRRAGQQVAGRRSPEVLLAQARQGGRGSSHGPPEADIG